MLDDLKSLYDLMGEVPPEIYEEKVDQLAEIFRDRKEAENLAVAFCKVEKIPVPVSASGSGIRMI